MLGIQARTPDSDNIHRFELANGMTLLVHENWANPTAVVRGYLRVGSALEPGEQTGLASFTVSMLSRGTATRSFIQLAESIEEVGASLGLSSGAHLTSISGRCLAEDLPMLLGILGETLQAPAFPAEHVERVRGQILNYIRQRDTNTGSVARLAFRRLLYPDGHPYGRPSSGTADTVNTITRDDLQRFYADHYTLREGILVVVGAVHAADAQALVERELGGWTPTTVPPTTAIPRDGFARLTEPRREVLTLDGKTQADLALGGHGITRADPDYFPLLVMNNILGQMGIGGRLGQRVREQEGLAYYVRSTFEAGLGAGPWYAYAGVNPRHVAHTVDLIRAEMRVMQTTPVEAEELADAQANLTGSLPLDVETNGGVAGELLNMEVHELGLDYLHRYAALVDAVSAESVMDVAQRRLDPDCFTLVVAGPEVG